MNIILIAKPLRENTNTKANALNNGWARSGSEEFKKFSHFVGVDKGIVRTNVLTGKKLSDKIRKEVGSGDSKLGKGGYFSTGDVLLGKDVVSYTVQVFSENNERVGVNTQSHRVQYNLPILADFSVIQDTVEPSRTVIEKIIPKLNIPEEEKKKKTSELAELISENVKVRYVDEQGRLLSLKNDTGIGEKESDGTYITNKKQLIGTSYNVTDKKLSSMTTTDGKYYTFKEADTNSASLTGNIVSEGRTVTLVYRESEAPTTATVTANYYKEGSQEKLAESVIKADLAIGSEYTTESKTIEGKTTTEGQRRPSYHKENNIHLGSNSCKCVPEDGATVDYYYRENVEETVVPKTVTSTETKTITRIIHYVDKVTNQNVKEDVVQPVTLSRTKTENKVTGVVTYGEWTTGNWDEVISGKIDKYKDPDIPTVESQEVTSDSSDKEITVRYDRLSTPDKPTPEPGTPKTETPVNPDPEVPTYETGKREELPNTGTEANATLASAGIMTLLASLGLGFFKKKEDEK
ncbi:putative sortase-sorted surface anchored protein (pseudogene) [Streptococcus pneumoniae]|nr:putative sortase-sorted surface anchored protein (pseudogene) [Streptococcus pneumoniae]